MKLIKKLLLSLFFISASAYAQFPGFNLEVGKTDETCPGNGSLTFSVSGVVQGASILYKVYHLPNTVTPIAVQQGNYLGSLQSGTYSVVAIQSLGSQNATQQRNITITRKVTDLNFTITAINQNCASGGSLIINTISGSPINYEIIDGPVTRPVQTSNIFELLPSGHYKIKVFDNCGVAKVKAYTLAIRTSILNISDAFYTKDAAVACDSIIINNIVSRSSGSIPYPLSVQYRLTPMSLYGDEIVIDQVYSTGDADSLVVSAVVPRYFSDSYAYELRVIDNCNTEYEKLDNIVDPTIGMALERVPMLCAQNFLKISPLKHRAPFTIEFVEAPTSFNAADFNPAGEGPFTDETINYGSESQGVPYGNYIVKITDACGRTAQDTINIDYRPLIPEIQAYNNGCFSMFGKIKINIAQQKLVTATIIAAPAAYAQAIPREVTGSINGEGVLFLQNMPLGTYKISFTDNCGFTYTVDVEVPPFVSQGFKVYTLPDCAPGYGTVRLKSGNNILKSAIITSAPAALGQTLPFDVTENIDVIDGDLYMDNLPEGIYTFKVVDLCNIEESITTEVIGYIPPSEDNVAFYPNCGSFSVKVMDAGNGTNEVSYWLQKFNPATGTWGHPNWINNSYPEGTVPLPENSILLYNNVQWDNLNYTGLCRVIKKFETYNHGVRGKKICISVIKEFSFSNDFSISNAFSLKCTGSPNDIFVEATGYGLTYRIEKKNGVDYVVENGSDNIFRNLELSATYVIGVEDLCGNKLTKEVTLRELPSIAEATTPDDMIVCVEENILNPLYQFRLRDQDTFILGSLHSSMYTLTYHITQQDADNGSNPLPEYYSSAGNGEIIYARLVHNDIRLCHGTTSFKLFVMHKPAPAITTTGTLCSGDGGTYLVAPDGFTNYLWSTGEITRSIFITEPGYYGVKVKLGDNDRLCEGFAEIVITESAAPAITDVEIRDWTDDENMITVFAEGMGNLLYSIDGENWQEDNVFTGLVNGFYTVFVKDAGGCGMVSKEVTLLNYPKFFTPNGDGINDTWRIKYSVKEPNLKINILDRFGKVVSSFGSNHEGWNGTFNGEKLPSTDYWFVVTREDGRELKGHFAMIR